MNLTKEQLDAVDLIVAQSVGQALHNPEDELEKLVKDWPKELQDEARDRLDEGVFYCEDCGWYCDADERHVGDLCDDCHDVREDGLED